MVLSMFNEKNEENGLPVYQTGKYIESKNKAIELINSGKYGLSESDFWIMMRTNKQKTSMIYTGLIISHTGCLKINDASENKVDPKAFRIDNNGYMNSLVVIYQDNDCYEVGEVNQSNMAMGYPYAVALKRCYDRVILKKTKIAFSGIYSEVEADEFKRSYDEDDKASEVTIMLSDTSIALAKASNVDLQRLCKYLKKAFLTDEDVINACKQKNAKKGQNNND